MTEINHLSTNLKMKIVFQKWEKIRPLLLCRLKKDITKSIIKTLIMYWNLKKITDMFNILNGFMIRAWKLNEFPYFFSLKMTHKQKFGYFSFSAYCCLNRWNHLPRLDNCNIKLLFLYSQKTTDVPNIEIFAILKNIQEKTLFLLKC